MSERIKRYTETNNALIHNIRSDVYSKYSYNAMMGIGSANKYWVPCAFEGPDLAEKAKFNAYEIVNRTTDNVLFIYTVPYEMKVGNTSHAMVHTATRVSVISADGANFLTRMRSFRFPANAVATQSADDNTNYTATTSVTYNHSDFTVGVSFYKLNIVLNLAINSAEKCSIGQVEAQIYYTE